MVVRTILIIDEDRDFHKTLSSHLRKLHFNVLANDNDTIKMQSENTTSPDMIILNPVTSSGGVKEYLQRIKAIYNEIPFIVLCNQKNYNVVVESMKFGAIDYIVKPTNLFDLQELANRIASMSSQAIRIRAASALYESLIDSYEKQLKPTIVSANSDTERVIDDMTIAASQQDQNVFITGEAGVGKSAVAQGIHSLSNRRSNSFIRFNCLSIAPLLLESELLGHSINPRTRKKEIKHGLIESAAGGILFLQEISVIPLSVQKLLAETIKTKKIKRLSPGSQKSINVRFISSSSRDLNEMVSFGAFDRELFELLNEIQIDILPLRYRKEDIILFSRHFINIYSEIMQRSRPEISNDVLKLLLSYSYPKNVSDLRHMIKKAMILSDKNAELLRIQDFPDLYTENFESRIDFKSEEGFQPLDILETAEKNWLINALKFYHNNKTHVAKALHITRQSLNRRIEKYGLDAEK